MYTCNIMGVTASQVHRTWGALDFASRLRVEVGQVSWSFPRFNGGLMVV